MWYHIMTCISQGLNNTEHCVHVLNVFNTMSMRDFANVLTSL